MNLTCGLLVRCGPKSLERVIATSLDGYIDGPAGEIDWFFTEPGDQKQEPPRVTFSTAC